MKKICLITSSRAEYGLLENLINLFKNSKKFKTYLVVTGSHLEKKFGNTINKINKKKIFIKKIKINLKKDDKQILFDNNQILSKEIFNFSKKIKPDLFIVLGDRYEIFQLCSAIQFCNIPIAHIHGGEKTIGSMDDQMRHCITKLSHLHFVANNIFRQRVMQLGESPKNIFVVGGLGVDAISNIKLISKENLINREDILKKGKNILVTIHPDTLKPENTIKLTDNLCKALNKLKNVNIIITYPNFDNGHDYIIKKFSILEKKNSNITFIKSLGNTKFLSVMKFVDLFIGNSSSGFAEAPFFKTKVLNLGDRQRGRLKSKNIIDCSIEYNEIIKKISFLINKNFINKKIINYYGKPGASKKIFNIIKKYKFHKNILKKEFYDL